MVACILNEVIVWVIFFLEEDGTVEEKYNTQIEEKLRLFPRHLFN